MHNIDRITNEYEFENEFEFEGEGEGEFEFEGEGEGEGEFEFEFEGELEGEALELELATELLEVSNEQELEQFLGNIFKKVAKGVSSFAKSNIGRGLISGLKSIAKKALPMAGGALGNLLIPGLGGAIGSKLGGFASNLFELEFEGMSNEDREFEVARRFTRLAIDAGRRAAAAAASGAPATSIINNALKQAAYNHAPGLLRRRRRARARARAYGAPGAQGVAAPSRPYRTPGIYGPSTVYGSPTSYATPGMYAAGGEPQVFGNSGTWVKRGDKIIVYGA